MRRSAQHDLFVVEREGGRRGGGAYACACTDSVRVDDMLRYETW
jgi:hypothetical protein